MRKVIKYIIFGIIICLISMWVSSLIKCEILTHKHYDEFKDAYKQNQMLSEMEYFKVLEYSPYNLAKIYYVSKGNKCADVLTFKFNSDTNLWEEISWNTIWSTTGSASEVIYPYWWLFLYGGF